MSLVPTKASVSPTESSRPGWLLRIVTDWAHKSGPLHPDSDKSSLKAALEGGWFWTGPEVFLS